MNSDPSIVTWFFWVTMYLVVFFWAHYSRSQNVRPQKHGLHNSLKKTSLLNSEGCNQAFMFAEVLFATADTHFKLIHKQLKFL